jgi:hypothetical protein
MTGRGLAGRQRAQAMLFIACAVVVFEAFLFITAPSGCMCPMPGEPPPMLGWLVPAIGIGGQALGIAWMIRIYRADPEAAPSSWRSKRS